MRIVIDARMYQESGVGRYIRNLIYKLQQLDKKNEYFILLLQKDYDNLVFKNNFRKILANFRWYGIKEQLNLPAILNKLKPDLVHFPHFNAPIFYGGKFIVTIHDLIHQHFRMDRATTLNPITYKLKQIGYNKVFQNAVDKSIKILVPSNYVKNLLIKKWGIEGDKIMVTYEAVDDKLLKMATGLSKNEIVKPPYIFYVGNAHPHKNVEGLIKAFLKLKEKYSDLKFVLSGYDHYFWQRLRNENQQKGIIYTGYVDDEELIGLYKNASCFVMPSFEEGFGIPLLEAMACSCAVVSSNAGALKEVGGDACLYFDPYSKEDMAEKISQVLDDQDLRNRLIKLGRSRYKKFSWEDLAKQTMKGYLQCV